MDGATLQGLIWRGYALAAAQVGFGFAQYRPTSALAPLATAVRSVSASFNAEDMGYRRPHVYGKALWFCVADGSVLAVGDYLVGDATYFIAAMPDVLPVLAVRCNRVVSVLRAGAAGVGDVGNLGDVGSNEWVLMAGWPASVLQGTKGEQNPTGLPEDMRMPWWVVLLPAWPGLTLLTGDILLDDLGHRYVVSSPELTAMGWRLTAMMAET